MTTRTLVIEDNPANLQLMAYLLKAFGHTVITALDGESGVKTAQQERPELIICDVHLPGINGYEVARRLKGEPAMRSIPVIAVTALAMVGDRDKVLAAGFDGYLSKPINPETFVREVEAFMHRDIRSQDGPLATPEPVAIDATQPSQHRPTIMVLDNESVNLELARKTLVPFGYTIVTAREVQEGLEVARRVCPALILCDVHLSGESGFDFLEALKADPALNPIPFAFLTSTTRQEIDMANGLASGAVDFITRPIEPEALLARIEHCLTKREVK